LPARTEADASPPPALRRNVYAFGATSFLNDTASEMAYWIVPAFLVTLGAGPATLGLIEGVAESVASLAKLYSGWLADRLPRRKPVVLAGYAAANAMKPLLAFATAWWHVLLIRFADRLGKGVRGAARDVMLAESVPKRALGGAFGLLQSMDTAGAIAGPLLALWLLRQHDMRTVFWIAALPGFASVVVLWFGARETSTQRARGAEPMPLLSGPALPRSFYYVLAAVALFSLGNSSDMFLVLRAESAGIPAAQAPLLGLAFNVTYTLASWPAGKLSDRWPRRAMAACGYVIFAAVYAVFALAPSKPAIWGAMAFYGLFYAFTNPVLRALVAATVAPEARGRAFGIFYFATSIAVLLASVVTGELWSRFGAPLPFWISTALAAIAAVMLLARSEDASPRRHEDAKSI